MNEIADKIARQIIDVIPAGVPGMFNPWKEDCSHDSPTNNHVERIHRLARHLDCDAKLILCGEAPGFRGCRAAGVAFTSERLLLEGAIPRIDPPADRLSDRRLPFSEPSATIVWKALYRLGVAEHTILWNAVQLHPFKAGNVWSNRTPNDAEIALGLPALRMIVALYPFAKIVAVGKKAAGLLRDAGIPIAGDVRHPANGGATLFSEQLEAILASQRANI